MRETPSHEQLRIWVENYLRGTISEEDKIKLESWYNAMPNRDINWPNPNQNTTEALRIKLLDAINNRIDLGSVHQSSQDTKSKSLALRKYLKYAAVLFILAGLTSVYILYRPIKKQEKALAHATIYDVQPGSTKATLTLSNGKKIILDSSRAVNIKINNGVVSLFNHHGERSFLNKGPQLNIYNTLRTQKGEQAPPITLSDGSKVWVNAASSLRFPLSFTGKTREIFLTGEAYFEVAKDPQHPFIVNTGVDKVKVLGTHFDVMAYKEEPYTYTTLLEGSVLLTNGQHTTKLRPGEQGQIDNIGRIQVKKVDADQSIAWTQGEFPMDGVDLLAFMRAVCRWYNVDVIYQGKAPTFNFSGSLNRNVPLSQLLTALNGNGIHAELKEGKIVVYNK